MSSHGPSARRKVPPRLLARLAGALLAFLLCLALTGEPAVSLAQDPVSTMGVADNRVKNWSFETFAGPTIDQKVGKYRQGESTE